MNTLVLITFIVASSILALYSLNIYVLLALASRQTQTKRQVHLRILQQWSGDRPDEDWPLVTTQIPLYNERDVAERVIHAVAGMNYPRGRHEIQILDDSTDITQTIVDRTVRVLREKGHDLLIVRRSDRAGYKAGALANGLTQCRGEFVAVFDADFAPPRDFLRRAVPLLASDEGIACVQGRWDHLNTEESWLTRAQALGIDGHFAVEQAARSWNGLLMNFNGTAGIWRKAAIDDPAVGGWQGDTLTEDLDLSYRAQLSGWRIEYCMDLVCPGEIPSDIQAFKAQQRRWATGSMQVARKLLPHVWKSPIKLTRKIEATLHLTYYSVSFWLVLLLVISQPMIRVWLQHPISSGWIGLLWAALFLSTAAPPIFYLYSHRLLRRNWDGLSRIPWLMMLGMGVCVDSALAMFRGLFKDGGEFVRTPKSGNTSRRKEPSSYRAVQSRLWLVELGLGGYALTCALCYGVATQWLTVLFLSIQAAGLLTVGWTSQPSQRESIAGPIPPTEPLIDVSPA